MYTQRVYKFVIWATITQYNIYMYIYRQWTFRVDFKNKRITLVNKLTIVRVFLFNIKH